MVNLKSIFTTLFYGIFSYSSTRAAKIDSLAVAVVFRCVQILILGYIIGWELLYKKGYQASDPVSSTVTTKVKGFGYNVKNQNYSKIFDSADYIIPPNEYNSIFIMTNFIATEQRQGKCEEDLTKPGAICKNDTDCETPFYNTWSGIPTGRCINSTINETLKVCEVSAWCPVENDDISNSVNINNVLNYTIFIKNDVEFKTFHKKERNILTNITNKYIATCTYEPIRNPYCPVFLINDILKSAESDPEERDLMLINGAVIQIAITWNCNYDYYSSECQPKYTFERFDFPFKKSSTASGFNFRYSDKFKANDVEYRKLVKAFGLRFIIIVEGKAGKFNVLPLMLTIGAGLGLLSLSTLVANFYMLNLHKKRKLYQKLTMLDLDNQNDDDGVVTEEDDSVKTWQKSQLSIAKSASSSILNLNYNPGSQNISVFKN